ncbi:MAG: hypothetical protein II702_00405 [Clostridia bacterium]|nr:hypothetical protein [Clostridia bacterium]
MGFCTKLLPGALYRLLVGVYTKEALTVYLNILYMLFSALLAFLLEKFILYSPKEYRFESCIISVLFLVGPLTFQMFQKILCMLDFYWVLFFAVGYILLKRKYLKFLLPAVLFAMILVHYSSAVCYVAATLLLILFFASGTDEKKERTSYLVLFAVSCVVSVTAALYFLAFEEQNLVYSLKEFDDVLLSRNATYHEYYDFVFYRYVTPGTSSFFSISSLETPHSAGDFLKNVFYQMGVTLQVSSKHIFEKIMVGFVSFVFGIVFYVFNIGFYISYFKSTGNRFKKTVAVLMLMLQLAVFFVGLFFSTDTIRWLSHSVIIMFTFMMTILIYDGEHAYKYIKHKFSDVSRELLVIFCFLYSFMTAYPYFY